MPDAAIGPCRPAFADPFVALARGQCVEFSRSFAPVGVVPVRDSKVPNGPALVFPADCWGRSSPPYGAGSSPPLDPPDNSLPTHAACDLFLASVRNPGIASGHNDRNSEGSSHAYSCHHRARTGGNQRDTCTGRGRLGGAGTHRRVRGVHHGGQPVRGTHDRLPRRRRP
ncbi:DUF397 domain-containing protein [Streptomyces sp. NPDC059679]|uniref:DUF397 domain-containing protein n=1 Tax=Streptomyces sp. NPDC059679 TaxID=3346903 RepID=UPI0036A741FC